MEKKAKIEDLGYDSFFESARRELGLSDFSVARVTSVFKEAYKVRDEKGEYFAKITGRQIFNALSKEDFPAVGDFVAISKLENDQAIIQKDLPRRTVIKRKHGDKTRRGEKDETQIIATNIDIAFVVESLDRDYSLNRFERYFAIIESGGAKPAIILNKIDLISKKDLEDLLAEIKNRFSGVDVILTSAVSDEGLLELKNYIKQGLTYCFLGSSGVGKSSLINKLLGNATAKTGEISQYSDRGKHVTTSRQMYFLANGGIVIDNPGMREVGISDSQSISNYFDEITSISESCKFADCTHTHEPGCAVVRAVGSGDLDNEKYSNFQSLKKEAEHFEMNNYEKREKDREFGKFLKKAKKQIKDYKS